MRLRHLLALGLTALAALGCEDRTRTQRVPEQYLLVPGLPGAAAGTPEVLVDPTRANDAFKVNVPRQCDRYQQLSVREVDILFVVDSSGSMAPKQQRLQDSFLQFIEQLVTAEPPINFHIGVVSTDTDDTAARGNLREWKSSGADRSYIACAPKPDGTGSTCNTADPQASQTVQKDSARLAFETMSEVGISGSAQERGLLAAYYALTNPANIAADEVNGFIRPNAALYVVVVSDEDDASCNPLRQQEICTADPGCRCAPDNQLTSGTGFGSTDYFVRFFETYKGYGNGAQVAVAAIIATEGGASAGIPSQFNDPNQHVGCCIPRNGEPTCPTSGPNDGGYEVAYFGGRYATVAAETGGVAVSICQETFGEALSALGYAASGLRTDYRLTRGPRIGGSDGGATLIEAHVALPGAMSCRVDGNCDAAAPICRGGLCGNLETVSLDPGAAVSYQKCESTTFRNVVRFDPSAPPPALSTVQLCYDVDSEFETTCL